MSTFSQTKDERSSGRETWLQINLGSVHCVEKVIVYHQSGDVSRSWTCSDSDCTCEGSLCDELTLTVSTEGAAPDSDPSPFFNCSVYGDTVKYESNHGKQMGAYEIAIIRKPGKQLLNVTTH